MYADQYRELFQKLGERQLMVLATSEGSAVSARTMSVVIHEGKFYFQTGANMRKTRQMEANDRVALCRDNIQIEGSARQIGHPFDPNNAFFRELYRRHYAGSYGKYSPLEEERVWEVTPSHIILWGYDVDRPYRDYFDLVRLQYEREYVRVR